MKEEKEHEKEQHEKEHEIVNIIVSELSRIPQSLTYDYKAINRAFGCEDGMLIRDLLIYLSGCKMKNLFGEISFGIDEFCKVMGYTRTHLQKKLSEIRKHEIYGKTTPVLESQIMTGKHQHKIETVFESALWRAMNQNVAFVRQKGTSTTYNSVQIISEFSIDYNKNTKRKTKRIYSVKLGAELTNYLLTQYSLIELHDYKSLPNIDGYRNFYIYLSRMIFISKFSLSKNEDPTYILSVDQLSDILEINITTPKIRKNYLTRILKKLQKILISTKFDFEYIKNGTKYAYFVKFTFNDATLTSFDEHKKAVFFQSLYKACEQMFIKDEYGNVYNRETANNVLADEAFQQKFIIWFSSENRHLEKLAIFKKIHNEVFKEGI